VAIGRGRNEPRRDKRMSIVAWYQRFLASWELLSLREHDAVSSHGLKTRIVRVPSWSLYVGSKVGVEPDVELLPPGLTANAKESIGTIRGMHTGGAESIGL